MKSINFFWNTWSSCCATGVQGADWLREELVEAIRYGGGHYGKGVGGWRCEPLEHASQGNETIRRQTDIVHGGSGAFETTIVRDSGCWEIDTEFGMYCETCSRLSCILFLIVIPGTVAVVSGGSTYVGIIIQIMTGLCVHWSMTFLVSLWSNQYVIAVSVACLALLRTIYRVYRAPPNGADGRESPFIFLYGKYLIVLVECTFRHYTDSDTAFESLHLKLTLIVWRGQCPQSKCMVHWSSRERTLTFLNSLLSLTSYVMSHYWAGGS